MRAIEKVIWALDPFSESGSLRRQVVPFLRALGAGRPMAVQPVYVLGLQQQLDINDEFATAWPELSKEDVLKAMRSALAAVDLPGLLMPEVLVERVPSLAHAARAVVAHAQSVGVDAIVVSSHGRKGMARLFLGSFSETLFDHSTLPVLAVGPRYQAAPRIRSILFPTDFGQGSRKNFRRVIALASDLGASVVLFHLIPRLVEPILQSGAYLLGASWVPMQAFFSDVTRRRGRRADLWARWARARGVSTEPVVDAMVENIAEMISVLARQRGVDLVAMEHRHGPIASTWVGSISRQVIRDSECPVWLFRPDRFKDTRGIRPGARRRAA